MGYELNMMVDGSGTLCYRDDITGISINPTMTDVAIGRPEGIKLPDGCKTMLAVNPRNEKIGIKVADDDGMAYGITDIMPDITGVEITEGICPVTTVYFSDGTCQKAKADYHDGFNIEQGISACIFKKMCDIYAPGHGSSIYNKLVDRGMNVFKRQQKEIEKFRAEEAERKAIAERRKEKNKKRKAKKAARDRENKIEIMAEAIRRAMNR